jgi:hypothetical protein
MARLQNAHMYKIEIKNADTTYWQRPRNSHVPQALVKAQESVQLEK